MEIDELVSLVTKRVKERLEAFEKRKKVLMLGNFKGACLENLCSMLESSGFKLCAAENGEREQDIDEYEFIVVTKAEFMEMLHKSWGAEKYEASEAGLKRCKIEKRVVTERDIQAIARDGCREMIVGKKTVITPLAFDSAKLGQIRIVRE